MHTLHRPTLPHQRLGQAVRRHPFFLWALALHAAGLWAASHWHTEGQLEARLDFLPPQPLFLLALAYLLDDERR